MYANYNLQIYSYFQKSTLVIRVTQLQPINTTNTQTPPYVARVQFAPQMGGDTIVARVQFAPSKTPSRRLGEIHPSNGGTPPNPPKHYIVASRKGHSYTYLRTRETGISPP